MVTDNGEVIQDDIEKANLINSFFALQSTIDDTGKTLPPFQNHTDASLENINISVTDVSDVLKCLDTSKAVGPDLISPRMLKEGSDA